MVQNSNPLLTREEAAAWLNVSQAWLENAAHRGGGPKVTKLGKRFVRYRVSDLERFVQDGATADKAGR